MSFWTTAISMIARRMALRVDAGERPLGQFETTANFHEVEPRLHRDQPHRQVLRHGEPSGFGYRPRRGNRPDRPRAGSRRLAARRTGRRTMKYRLLWSTHRSRSAPWGNVPPARRTSLAHVATSGGGPRRPNEHGQSRCLVPLAVLATSGQVTSTTANACATACSRIAGETPRAQNTTTSPTGDAARRRPSTRRDNNRALCHPASDRRVGAATAVTAALLSSRDS